MANAANRKQLDARARQDKAARAAELGDVRMMMSDPRGRAFAYRMLTYTGVEGLLKFQSNAMSLAHDVGVHSVGRWLLDEIREACPEQELIMRREAAIVAQRAEMQEEADNANE